ncbi:DUF3574 domain-containing protein [Francisella sp. XLW-1]|uniref:DUF3574 domain-containing protein n=1 Tax=Francisella sp. XLW-1 TaxID=2610887 RepID=UPI00123E0D17|nr:DUF3574 domain-containing protein [Francisella sp. XLW-1]
MKRYIITLALCIFVLSDTGFADTKDNQGYIVKLYFGRTMKDDKDNISYVSDKMFKNFENKYITPSFPDGYTENDARGYWRSPTGTTYSEKTKVVTILADDKSKQLEQKVSNLVNVYEKAYHQESVLVTYTKTDYSFI